MASLARSEPAVIGFWLSRLSQLRSRCLFRDKTRGYPALSWLPHLLVMSAGHALTASFKVSIEACSARTTSCMGPASIKES